MTILNLYQFALILSIVGVVAAGFWAKRGTASRVAVEVADHIPVELKRSPMKPSLEIVQEQIRALDVLFDDDVLSVDEYVEIRRRISSGQSV